MLYFIVSQKTSEADQYVVGKVIELPTILTAR